MTEPDTTTEESDDGRLLTSRRAVIGALASAGVIGATTGAASSDTSAAIGGGPVASEISDLEVRTYSGTFDERPDAGVEGRLYEVYDPGGEEHGAVFYDDGSSWDKVDRRVQNLYSESGEFDSLNTDALLNVADTIVGEDDDLESVFSNASDGDVIYLGPHEFRVSNPPTTDKSVTVVGSGKIRGLEDTPDSAVAEAFGTRIIQESAGEDVLVFSASEKKVDVKGLYLSWDSSIADSDTGHGIHYQPPTEDHGVLGGDLDSIVVDGHDGDHYAIRAVNPIHCSFNQINAFGGGGMEFVNSTPGWNNGNSIISGLYVNYANSGGAHGIHHKATAGIMNLNLFLRPQVNGPTGSQKHATYTEDGGSVRNIWLFGADFEGGEGGVDQPDNPTAAGTGYLPMYENFDGDAPHSDLSPTSPPVPANDGGKSLNTWYQNTSGYHKRLNVVLNAGEGQINCRANVNDSESVSVVAEEKQPEVGSGEPNITTLSFDVPASSYYQIESFGDESISRWIEYDIGSS